MTRAALPRPLDAANFVATNRLGTPIIPPARL